MSIEPVLLGIAAPAIVSSASTVSRTVDAVTQPFRRALNSASHLLSTETNSLPSREVAVPSSEQAPEGEGLRFSVLDKLLAGKFSAGSSTELSIEDVQTHASSLQTDIEKRVQAALTDAGIKLDSPLRLSVSGIDGTIEVRGAHPQRAVIEAALNRDPTLAADFQKLSTEREILDLFSRSRSFAKDFVTEPWRTIATQAGRDNQRHEASLEVASNDGRLQLRFD